MEKSEALDLIEHNRWALIPQANGGWVIEDSSPIGPGDDADVIEIARTRGNIVDAVKMALEGIVLATR